MGEERTMGLVRWGRGGTGYRNEGHSRYGTQLTSTSIVRTGGAADGATPISHQVTPTTNARNDYGIFRALPMTKWNGVTGANRNITLYGVANDSRVPNNDEV